LDPVVCLYACALFLFGLCAGSFLNVVIYRLPHGASLLHPPSTCPKCSSLIKWYDNLPVFSWLLLRAKCRSCSEPISSRYPSVELATGLLWGAVGAMAAKFTLEPLVLAGVMTATLVFVSILIAIAFIDYDLQIIPDELSIGGTVLMLGASAALPYLHPSWVETIPEVPGQVASLFGGVIGAVGGGGFILTFSIMGTLLFRHQITKAQVEDPDISTAIGFGDVKLLTLVGAFLGWQSVLVSFLFGTVFGALGGIVDKVRTGSWPPERIGIAGAIRYRWHSGGSVIPFGPFLCAGAMVMVFARTPVLDWFHSIILPLFR